MDDGSNDGTTDLIKSELGKEVNKVIYHLRNMEKGAAISFAVPYVTGDLVIIQDADLAYDPNEYTKLMAPIVEGKADVVYGPRFLGEGPHRAHMFWHYVGNKFSTILSNMSPILILQTWKHVTSFSKPIS